MATRNIVPRGNGEGQLGTSAKHWDKLFVDKINDGADLGNNASIGYRQPSTAYAVGNIAYHSALPTGYYLECTTTGITSAGDITPSSTIGGTVSDGTVTWTVTGVFNIQGESLDDANKATVSGQYRTGNAPTNNMPLAEYGNLLVLGNMFHNGGNVYGGNVMQLAFYPNYNMTFIRKKKGSDTDWSSWQQQEAIVAKSLGLNGYIKYASGLILQWGHEPSTSFVDSNTGKYITYPISFSSFSTSNVVASIDKNTSTVMEASVSKGTTGFTLYRSQLCSINWLAMGS